MRRQRRRSRTLSVMTLGVMLIAGLMAPAAMAVAEGQLIDDEPDVGGTTDENDTCALHVDLEGDLVYEHEYERPDVRYKKQVEKQEMRWAWKRWEQGVKEYQYAKQIKQPAVKGVKEFKWTRTEEHFEDQIKYHKVKKTHRGWTANHAHYVESDWITKPEDNQVPGLHTGGTFELDKSFKIGLFTYKYTVLKEQTVKTGETVEEQWSETNPGPEWTKTEWRWKVEPQAASWRFLEPDEPFYNIIPWGPQTSSIDAPGGPWTVGTPKFLSGAWYRYVQYGSWQWKPGHEPGWHHYDGEKSATAPDGFPVKVPFSGEWFGTGDWTWVKPHRVTDWMFTGDKIDTGIGSIGLVDPEQKFSFLGKTYKYVEWDTRSRTDWFLSDPGGEWTPTGKSQVYDASPNSVQVTINGVVVEEATFGESYTESFPLDHDDEYLVQYKLHGDEDWSVDQEGVADCIQPDADVDFTEWEEDELECDSESITLTRTQTTTPFTWDPETRTWVPDLEGVVEEIETDTRELTEEELEWQESEACIEVGGEVITKPDPEPEVEQVSVEKKVETEVLAETLPRTGASILTLLLSGLLALFVGTSALRRRQSDS